MKFDKEEELDVIAGLRKSVDGGYDPTPVMPHLMRLAINADRGDLLDYYFDLGGDREAACLHYHETANAQHKGLGNIHRTLHAWEDRGTTYIYSTDFPDTPEGLRRKDLSHQDKPVTNIVILAKAGRFPEVLARMDRLETGDLLETDGFGNTLLEILGARKQLGLLFTKERWAGRIPDLQILGGHIAAVYRDQCDPQALISALRRDRLRQRSGPMPTLKK
jgi:hypothetical protein